MNHSVQPGNVPTSSTNPYAKEGLVFGLLCGISLVVVIVWGIMDPEFFPCVSTFFLPAVVVMALIAISDGHKAHRQIKESQGTQTSERLAAFGLYLGYAISIIAWPVLLWQLYELYSVFVTY